MQNCMIGYPNRVDQGTLSGGSFVPTLPLSNIQTRTLGQVARTVDLTPTSTTFDLDLGKAQQVRVYALVNHNLSSFATYRLRGATDSGFSDVVFDSGAGALVWPIVFPYPLLEWEDDRWWSGRYSDEQLQGFYHTLTVILPTATVAQYWRLELSDPSNTDGFVQAGRVFVGPVWQPSKNPSFGLSNAWETNTDVQSALGGAETFQRRVPYRTTKFTFDYLSEDEALTNAYDMDRQAGIDQEVFWIHDPDDTIHAIRRQYLGRFRSLSPLEYPYFNTISKAYEIKELL